MTAKLLIQLAAVFGGLGVAIGAFGAHALHDMLERTSRLDTFETAVRYQFYHALALLAIGILWTARPELRALGTTGILWSGGIIIFSGSLYAICFTGITKLGAVAPVGGLLLMAGWLSLALAVRALRF